jgi:hypothetical protein
MLPDNATAGMRAMLNAEVAKLIVTALPPRSSRVSFTKLPMLL